jgi:hypothetical protein
MLDRLLTDLKKLERGGRVSVDPLARGAKHL